MGWNLWGGGLKGFGCTCGANLGYWGRTGEEEKKRGNSLILRYLWVAGFGRGRGRGRVHVEVVTGGTGRLG